MIEAKALWKAAPWKRRPLPCLSFWCTQHVCLACRSWVIMPITHEKTEVSRCLSLGIDLWLTRDTISFVKWKSGWHIWNTFHSYNLEDKIEIPQPAYEALRFTSCHSTSLLHSGQVILPPPPPQAHIPSPMHSCTRQIVPSIGTVPYLYPPLPSFPSHVCSVMHLLPFFSDAGQKQFLPWGSHTPGANFP